MQPLCSETIWQGQPLVTAPARSVLQARLFSCQSSWQPSEQEGAEPQLLAEQLWYFVPPLAQQLAVGTPEIQWLRQGNQLQLTLHSKVLLRQLWLAVTLADNPALVWNFSDNFVDLLPGQARSVTLDVTGLSDAQCQQLMASLSCYSIADTTGTY